MEILSLKNKTIDPLQIANEVENIIELVNNGQMDALDVLVRVDEIEKAVKTIAELKKKLHNQIDTDFDRKQENKRVVHGDFEITRVERKPSNDYSKDYEYQKLSDALKDRKTMLDDAVKLFEKGSELVIDGEQIPVVPVKGTGTIYFKIKKL